MKLWHIIAFSITLAFLCSCDRHDVVLAFNTQNASSQSFYLESTLNVLLPNDSANAKPESMLTRVNVRSTMNLLVPYDDGSARFEMKIDSAEYSSDKRSVDDFRNIEKFFSTQHIQFKMASDGMITEPEVEDSQIKVSDEDIDIVKLFLKALPILPSKPVSIGESWERSLILPGKSPITVYKSFTLEDLMLHDGVQIAKIDMNIKYKEDVDSTSNLQMESQGFVVGSGSIFFDVTHGIISSANLEINGDLSVNDLVADLVIPNLHVIQKIKLRGGI